VSTESLSRDAADATASMDLPWGDGRNLPPHPSYWDYVHRPESLIFRVRKS
jgi:hypothetical protein